MSGDLDFETVSLPEADCDRLGQVFGAEGACTVVEIGLAYGASALAIGAALLRREERHRRHVIVDAFQDRYLRAGWDVMLEAGLRDQTELVESTSQLALPNMVQAGERFDAAFVDGSHIFHNVFVDLFFLRHLVRPGGLVVLDDCDWPSVGTAVRYFELNAGWVREPIGDETRLSAYRLPTTLEEPAFTSFRPFGAGESRI